MNLRFGLLSLVAASAVVLAPTSADAFSFNKNNIISDSQLKNYQSMDQSTIKSFLGSHGSGLTNLRTTAADGTQKYAAKIIYETSQKYHLSPQFFLTMIQKESGLIERSDTPQRLLDWTLGYGVCDSCDKDDPQVKQYKGFGKQLDSAGSRVADGYLADLESRGYTVSGWGPGRTKTTVDGIVVTPENDATAVLYTYNPWVGAYGGGDPRWGANSLFSKKWQEYFPGRMYPNGSLLQDEDTKDVYLIQYGKKHRFDSLAALYINYSPERIITVPQSVLNFYSNGPIIRFPNYSLIRSPGGTVYLYVDGVKRGIASSEILRQLGFNPEEIIDADWRDLNRIPDGSLIKNTDAVSGGLVQDSSNGAVYHLEDKILHPIWSREIMDSQYRGQPIQVLSHSQIETYKTGEPIKFRDGALLATQGDPSVYVIANGRRRPISSGQVFMELGYSWDNIIFVPKNVLELHWKGAFIK